MARAGGLGFLAGSRRTPAQVTGDYAAAEQVLGNGASQQRFPSCRALYRTSLVSARAAGPSEMPHAFSGALKPQAYETQHKLQL